MFWLRLWAEVRVKHWKQAIQGFVFNKNIPYLISVNIAVFVCIPCLKVSSKYLMMTKCPIPVCKTVCDVDKPLSDIEEAEWYLIIWRLTEGPIRFFKPFSSISWSRWFFFFFRLLLILTEVPDSIIFGEPIAGRCGQLMISQNEITFSTFKKINKDHLFQTMPIKQYFHTSAMLKR